MDLKYGIKLDKPDEVYTLPAAGGDDGASWLLAALILVFVIACLRYRRNSRFLSMMLHEVTEVRERHNAFDDTVRETTFIWLLNLLWAGAAGTLLYGLLFHPDLSSGFSGVSMARLGICIGMAGVYTLFLTVAYSAVGSLFSDGAKASLWVRGYLSSQGLESVALFPLAVIALCLPGAFPTMVTIGIIMFFLAKILFIYKGFCIFFTQIASWVLFLYYLCSLEIVPIVLTYVSTRYLCSLV